jgi:2-C-methyl-D-erythritol 2,4-cyclodiphosphate synthase
MLKIRSGIGYDIHKITSGNGLYIGGVRVSDTLKFIAHSDGDVLLHALIDSLLGAIGENDIGEHFPDTDSRFREISSENLLDETLSLVKEKEFEILNVDCVVIAEQPKISSFKPQIRKNLADRLDIPESDINVKAKTREKLDAVGRGEAIECYCICMVRSIR